ncbi:MAG: radical SAM protein [Candidatus Omnitrophota bacterium]
MSRVLTSRLKDNYAKLKQHYKSGGMAYAVWRGLQYFGFLFKKVVVRPKHPRYEEISNGNIKIRFYGNGLSLFWNNARITEGAGLNLSVNTLEQWTDSAKADWSILKKTGNCFTFRVAFKELPLSVIWAIEIEDNDRISWHMEMETEEWLHIDELRIVCFVSGRYKIWIADTQQCDFPRLCGWWQDLYLSDVPVSLIGVRFPAKGEFLPSLVLETAEKEWHSLIQNPPINENTHLIGLRHTISQGKHDHSPGRFHVFTGRLSLFGKDNLLDSKLENFRQRSLRKTIVEKSKLDTSRRQLKVLLANLPWYQGGRWGVRAGSRWPHIKYETERDYQPFPFFLAYATSLLQKFGIDVSIIDAVAGHMSEAIFLEKAHSMGIDYLVAETSIPSFDYDLALLQKVSDAGIKIILCGPNSEIYKLEFLKKHPFIDFVLYGEYEFTLLELVECLEAGRAPSGIKGLIYRDKAGPIKNPPREPFDINLLPWPHRDSLPMGKYLDAPGELPLPSVQMIASRGCPFKCQFCLWPQVIYAGRHYRARSVEDTIDEMEYLVRERGFKSVYFDDDTFNIGKERMLYFCQELKRRGLDKTPWAIMARPDLMDKEILESMKDAGLWAVKYGMESTTQSLVDNIEKNMDLNIAEQMIRLTNKLGIRVHLTFTFGLPGETMETIRNTIKRVRELDPFSVQFSITTPFPGTKYYDALDKQGFIVSKNFSDYDGHYKSTIRLEGLKPQDLEMAKEMAYRSWRDHLRKRRGFAGDIKRFFTYLKDKGPAYAASKSFSYLNYVFVGRPKYLKMDNSSTEK